MNCRPGLLARLSGDAAPRLSRPKNCMLQFEPDQLFSRSIILMSFLSTGEENARCEALHLLGGLCARLQKGGENVTAQSSHAWGGTVLPPCKHTLTSLP
jgi:hypothetical protein